MIKRPSPPLRRVLAALDRRRQRCRRCQRIIRGVAAWDEVHGRRIGPYHPRCAPSFRDRMEFK